MFLVALQPEFGSRISGSAVCHHGPPNRAPAHTTLSTAGCAWQVAGQLRRRSPPRLVSPVPSPAEWIERGTDLVALLGRSFMNISELLLVVVSVQQGPAFIAQHQCDRDRSVVQPAARFVAQLPFSGTTVLEAPLSAAPPGRNPETGPRFYSREYCVAAEQAELRRRHLEGWLFSSCRTHRRLRA